MTVVIGAGPYGLSVAAHVRGAGAPVRIFGETLGTWRHNMPEGMLLKSMPSASSLSSPLPGSTLADYLAAHGMAPMADHDVVPADLFVDYGIWFAERNVPDVEPERVARVERTASGYAVHLTNSERIDTPHVVVASGLMDFGYVPATLRDAVDGQLGAESLVSHSSQHRDLSRFAGANVALIGAGQSALETAALLHEAGAHPLVLHRGTHVQWGDPPAVHPRARDQILHPPSVLGPGYSHLVLSRGAGAVRFLPASTRLMLVRNVLGPSGSWWLRNRFEGHVPVRTRTRVRHAIPGSDGITLELALPDGGREKIEADHVIAATGYCVDIDRLDFLDEAVRRRLRRVESAPRLGPAFESSEPGLYFAGLASAATFGPLMRFVAGTEFAARRISRDIRRGGELSGGRRARAA